MARVQNPIIGRASGAFATGIFSTWKGINVLRSRPLEVANPRTDGQLQQRSRMTVMVDEYRNTSGAVKLGYVQQAVEMSEYNAFISDNIMDATTLSGNTASKVPASMVYAKGTIAPHANQTVTHNAGTGDITITYPSTADLPGQSVTDNITAVVYNETQNTWSYDTVFEARSTGSADISQPADTATGDSLHVYAFFNNAAEDEASDSVYTALTAS